MALEFCLFYVIWKGKTKEKRNKEKRRYPLPRGAEWDKQGTFPDDLEKHLEMIGFKVS